MEVNRGLKTNCKLSEQTYSSTFHHCLVCCLWFLLGFFLRERIALIMSITVLASKENKTARNLHYSKTSLSFHPNTLGCWKNWHLESRLSGNNNKHKSLCWTLVIIKSHSFKQLEKFFDNIEVLLQQGINLFSEHVAVFCWNSDITYTG